jgi:CRISPR-associated endonuclease/helicase Cas3
MPHALKFVTHIRKSDGTEQTVEEHLEETAALAKTFVHRFGNGNAAWLCGLFHDIGKYSEAFQKRIYGESSRMVDHSTAGAKELNHRYGKYGAHAGILRSGSSYGSAALRVHRMTPL